MTEEEFRRELQNIASGITLLRQRTINAPLVGFARGTLFQAYKEGLSVGKTGDVYEWRATSQRVCPACERLSGQWFRKGQGPEPPLHINCRCIMVWIGPQELESLGPEKVEGRLRRSEEFLRSPEWEALKQRHAHFLTAPKKYRPLKVPAGPSGRDFVFRRVRDPVTGEMRSYLRWRRTKREELLRLPPGIRPEEAPSCAQAALLGEHEETRWECIRRWLKERRISVEGFRAVRAFELSAVDAAVFIDDALSRGLKVRGFVFTPAREVEVLEEKTGIVRKIRGGGIVEGRLYLTLQSFISREEYERARPRPTCIPYAGRFTNLRAVVLHEVGEAVYHSLSPDERASFCLALKNLEKEKEMKIKGAPYEAFADVYASEVLGIPFAEGEEVLSPLRNWVRRGKMKEGGDSMGWAGFDEFAKEYLKRFRPELYERLLKLEKIRSLWVKYGERAVSPEEAKKAYIEIDRIYSLVREETKVSL